MFISKKLHNKIVRAKEDEIVTLEDKIENRDILIADLQAENLAVHDESKDVRFENEELNDKITDLNNNIELLANNLTEQNKELVDNLDTEN